MQLDAGTAKLLAYGDLAVLWILVAMSLWGVAIGVTRLLALRAATTLLNEENSSTVSSVLQQMQENKADLDYFHEDFNAASRSIVSDWNKGLPVLGTMGSSAPFIGLFGTVLGIIKAFQDLALVDKAGPQVVMAGISQALIATAMGLLVAIPAVVAFNYFSLRTQRMKSELQNRVWQQLAAAQRGE